MKMLGKCSYTHNNQVDDDNGNSTKKKKIILPRQNVQKALMRSLNMNVNVPHTQRNTGAQIGRCRTLTH